MTRQETTVGEMWGDTWKGARADAEARQHGRERGIPVTRQTWTLPILLALAATAGAHEPDSAQPRCGGNAGNNWRVGLSVRQPETVRNEVPVWVDIENRSAAERVVCLPPRVVTTLVGAGVDTVGTGSAAAFGPHSCSGQLAGWLVQPSAQVSSLLLLDPRARAGTLQVWMRASELEGPHLREGGVVECEVSQPLNGDSVATTEPTLGLVPAPFELVVRRADRTASTGDSSVWLELHNRGDVPIAACIELLEVRARGAKSDELPASVLSYDDRCPDERTVRVQARGVVTALAWVPTTAESYRAQDARSVDVRILLLDDRLQQRTRLSLSAPLP